MTPSGWMMPRPRCSGSSHGGSWPSRSACCWPSGRQPASGYFPACRRCPSKGLPTRTRGGLLTAAVPGHLDERVRDRIIAETSGNPLGLLELARGMSEAELAGGFAGPPKANRSGHLQDQLQDHYLRQVRALPGPTRQLMLLAAADPTGDATLLWRAAQTVGLGRDAAVAAGDEEL